MVARITYPGNLLNALNYHEQKVKKGNAEGLHAENFLAQQLLQPEKTSNYIPFELRRKKKKKKPKLGL